MLPDRDTMESKERLDRIGQSVLRSLKVSEEEIEVVAGSPDLYDRLRLRIEAGAGRWRGEGASANGRLSPVRRALRFITSQGPGQARVRERILWLAAVALVLLMTATLMLWRPRSSQQQSSVEESTSVKSAAVPRQEIESKTPATSSEMTQVSAPVAAAGASRRTLPRRRERSHSSEVATDFFPLTFIADSTASQSGQVVRVRIPRSALVSFGLPMNVERAGELVKADVVIGDDGLARAIRFIQ